MSQAIPPAAPGGPPLPVEITPRDWAVLAERPEVRRVEQWAPACRAWWDDARDDRLRRRGLTDLLLSEQELAAWCQQRLDRAGLIRAQDHVMSMRAGLEHNLGLRNLSTGALRTTPVWSRNRLGKETLFVAPEEVPRRVDELCTTYHALPAHPFLRTGWLIHAICAVHPFRDANGGTARFLASLELARCGLPPFTLSLGLRNGEFMDALVDVNEIRSIDRLAALVADVVQRGVAATLLAGEVRTAPWSPPLEARASAWLARVGLGFDRAVGDDGAGEATDTSASLRRLLRRGYRVPVVGTRYACWRARGAPVQLDVALAPVAGGPRTWLAAMLAVSVGPGGELGALDLDDRLAPVFVAVDDEPDLVADARFATWLDARIGQYIVGVSRWM